MILIEIVKTLVKLNSNTSNNQSKTKCNTNTTTKPNSYWQIKYNNYKNTNTQRQPIWVSVSHW